MNLMALPILFIFAKFVDKCSAKIMIPISFLFQIAVMMGYYAVPTPDHWSAYFMSVFQAGCGFVCVVTTQSYVAKRCPTMIRGMIMGILGVFSSFGIIAYLMLVQYTIPDYVGYAWVFGYVAIMDAVILIFLVILICLGKFGDSARHEDNALD